MLCSPDGVPRSCIVIRPLDRDLGDVLVIEPVWEKTTTVGPDNAEWKRGFGGGLKDKMKLLEDGDTLMERTEASHVLNTTLPGSKDRRRLEADYKGELTPADLEKHQKVKPRMSLNARHHKVNKIVEEDQYKPGFRRAMEGVTQYAIAGLLGEPFRGNESFLHVLTRAGVSTVIDQIHESAASFGGSPGERLKGPNVDELSVLEEIGQFAVRNAIASGQLGKQGDQNAAQRVESFTGIAEVLHVNARLGATKFLQGTNEHLEALGVMDLMDHESNVGVKALIVTLFGKQALPEIGGKFGALDPDDPRPLVYALTQQALRAVVDRIAVRGESRLKIRAKAAAERRNNTGASFSKICNPNEPDSVHGKLHGGTKMHVDPRTGVQKKTFGGDPAVEGLVMSFNLSDHGMGGRPGDTSHGKLDSSTKDTALLVQKLIQAARQLQSKCGTEIQDMDTLADALTDKCTFAVVQYCPHVMVERNMSLLGIARTLYGLDVVVSYDPRDCETYEPEATKHGLTLKEKDNLLLGRDKSVAITRRIPKITLGLGNQLAEEDFPQNLIAIVETEIDTLGVIHDIASGAASSIVDRGFKFCDGPMDSQVIRRANDLAETLCNLMQIDQEIDGEIMEDFKDALNCCIADELLVLQYAREAAAFSERELRMIYVDAENTVADAAASKDFTLENIVIEVGGVADQDSRAQSLFERRTNSLDVIVGQVIYMVALLCRQSSEIANMHHSMDRRGQHAPVKFLTNILDQIDSTSAEGEAFSSTGHHIENDQIRVYNSIVRDTIERRCSSLLGLLEARLGEPSAQGAVPLVEQLMKHCHMRAIKLREALELDLCQAELKHEPGGHLPGDIKQVADFVQVVLKSALESRKPGPEGIKSMFAAVDYLAGIGCYPPKLPHMPLP